MTGHSVHANRSSRCRLLALLALASLLGVGASCGASDEPDAATPGAGGKADDAEGTGTCNPAGNPFGGGHGTAADPFLVCAQAQLERLGLSPGLSYYRLASDLDLGRQPVRLIERFSGSFDGGGHTLRGLLADGEAGDAALFNESYGTIENLRVEGFNIRGAALLINKNYGVLKNSSLAGTVDSDSTYATGGAVAENYGIVVDVRVAGLVSGVSSVGGVVGKNQGTGIVAHSFFTGDARGGSVWLGGIAGMSSGLLTDVHAEGTVKMGGGVGRGAGGVVGWLEGGSLLELASAKADLYSYDSAGGLVGRTRGGLVRGSRFEGTVKANESAGGLFGLIEFGASFDNCYALANVATHNSEPTAFGVASVGDLAHSFFYGTVDDASSPGAQPIAVVSGQTGLGTEALACAETFAGFDSAVWQLDSAVLQAQGRPNLRWEEAPPAAPTLPLVPVTVSVFSNGYPKPNLPIAVEMINSESKRTYFGAFGLSPTSPQWAIAVVWVPPGTYQYAVRDEDTLYGLESYCRLRRTPGSGSSWHLLQETVGENGLNLSPWAECHHQVSPPQPKPGPYLSAPVEGSVLFSDDVEAGIGGWKAYGAWNRVTDLGCVSDPHTSGSSAWYFGVPSTCNYSAPNPGHEGELGWLTSPPIEGIGPSSVLTFWSYRDLDDVGWSASTTVDILPAGGAPLGSNGHAWRVAGGAAGDRSWQKITVPLGSLAGFPSIQIRFIGPEGVKPGSTNLGWLVDDIQVVR